MTYEVKYFKSQNTIQEDLFLLAKGHYKTQNIERLTALRLILAVHVTGMDYIRDRDLLHWLLSSFYNPGIILPRREDVHRLMVNPGSIHTHLQRRYTKEQLMIFEILNQVSTLQVRAKPAPAEPVTQTVDVEGYVWLLPFPHPKIDPKMQSLFDSYAAHEADILESPLMFDESGPVDEEYDRRETIAIPRVRYEQFLMQPRQSHGNRSWAERVYQYFKFDDLVRPANKRWAERFRSLKDNFDAERELNNKLTY